MSTTNCLRGYEHKFYFIHNTLTLETLEDVLKDGYIKLGKNVKTQHRKLSDSKLDYVYGQIYFEDLDNIKYFWSPSIILHPKIMCDIEMEFHRGWGALPTKSNHIIRKTDSESKIRNKLNDIRKFLKDPKELPTEIRKSFVFNHEVVFNKKISIKKYAVGITCNFADKKTMNKIKQIILDKKYKLKIIHGNYPMPKYDELLNQ